MMDWSTSRKFWSRLNQSDMQGLSHKEAFVVLDGEEVSEIGSIPLSSLIDKLQELGELEPLQAFVAQGTEPAAGIVGLLETLRSYGGMGIVLTNGHHHRKLLARLVTANQLSKEAGIELVRAATTTRKVWAGLKPGHIQNARYQMTGKKQEN